MPIIGALPFNILNGDSIDAIPVMADFNFIVSQVNANVQNLTIVTPTAFVPTIAFGGAAVGLTYTARTAAYTRIGSMIFYTIDIILNALGSSTGVCQIGGLPVAVNTAWPTGGLGSTAIFTTGVTFSGYLTASPSPGNTYLVMRNSQTAASGNFITDGQVLAGSSFSVTGMYAV